MSVDFPNLIPWTVIQTGTVTPHVRGTVGVGKTSIANSFAKAVDRHLYTLIGSLREPADIGGYPYPIHVERTSERDPETGKRVDVYMKLVAPEWAQNCLDDSKPWAILFDEITCVAPAVQAALLRVMLEKVVGETPLPQRTWMMAASNPPGIAANGQELEPPLANRLVHIPWEMDWGTWSLGMQAGLRRCEDGTYSNQFPVPTFRTLPDDWHERTSAWGTLIDSFRRHKPNLFETTEEDMQKDRENAGKAFPSPRTWTFARDCAAALESIDAEPVRVKEAVCACVGDSAAGEFWTWKSELDLPDPEIMLQLLIKPQGQKLDFDGLCKAAFKKENLARERRVPRRGDQVMAVIGAVTDRVRRENTKERWDGAALLLEKVWASDHREIAAISAGGLLQPDVKKKEYALSADFIKELYPVLSKAGWLSGGRR